MFYNQMLIHKVLKFEENNEFVQKFGHILIQLNEKVCDWYCMCCKSIRNVHFRSF